ncbi:hypothetical protein [Thermoactinomyces mirandus]|uniref:Uncharacterized protein n=1 Tax=Thermoactinomyces mirandus TaxID=2756294 RepID=A0A7W1XRX3_9BACL|nr:hypothetical protein [Thermoactinomyces mirandus]MBA4602021.1 hypothetical protein [Thermoactinomyces mirandus]
MTYLILFYAVLVIVGGIVLYVINSRSGKKKKTERKWSLPETDRQHKPVVTSSGSSDAISDTEYREVLRKWLKAQTGVKEKPVKDPLKYSDEKYREVLRSMHKRLHQDKGTDQ